MNKIYVLFLAVAILASGSVHAVFDTVQECRQACTAYAIFVRDHRANIGNPAVDEEQVRFVMVGVYALMEQIKESAPAQMDPTLVQCANAVMRSALDVWIELTAGTDELINTPIPASIGLALPRGRAVPRQLF